MKKNRRHKNDNLGLLVLLNPLLWILRFGKRSIFPMFFFLLVLVFACQEKIAWELELENELNLVVDGKITNERKAHEVKLSRPVFEINGDQEAVSGAEVYIYDGDTVFPLTEDAARPGVYLTSTDVQGVVNKVYYLVIKVDGFEYSAAAVMEGVTPIRLPDYYMVNEDPPLYKLNFYGTDEPSMIKLEMDWSSVPGYDTLQSDQNHAIIYGYYFSVLTVDVNELFAPEADQVFFPPGTNVIITKESLSEGYAEYLRGLLSETTWNGGLFDVKSGDPFTNLSEGALGYFAASTVIRDTIIFWP